jgi:hypothetical protein
MQTPTMRRKAADRETRPPRAARLLSYARALVSGCQAFLQCGAARPQAKVHTPCPRPQATAKYIMLVESDVQRGVHGILP